MNNHNYYKGTNPYTFAIWWCTPLKFKIEIIQSNKILRLKYLRSTALGCKEIGIRKLELVPKLILWIHIYINYSNTCTVSFFSSFLTVLISGKSAVTSDSGVEWHHYSKTKVFSLQCTSDILFYLLTFDRIQWGLLISIHLLFYLH